MMRSSAVFLLDRMREATDPVAKARYEERVIAAMMYAPAEGTVPDPLDMKALLRSIDSLREVTVGVRDNVFGVSGRFNAEGEFEPVAVDVRKG